MKPLRLIADDLTGALDSAAQFAGPGREIPVYLGHRLPAKLPAEFAVDSASREGDAGSAAAAAARLAPMLAPSDGATSFRKVDSLLRGHPGLELAATLETVQATYCIVAPAFPYHERVTRGGLQYVRREGAWQRAGEDLRAALESRGLSVSLARPGDAVPRGISLWDAESDHDLRRIAHSGSVLPEPVLWCGSGGLAAALSAPGSPPLAITRIGRPMLGLVGSDHQVTAAQLEGIGVLDLVDGGAGEASHVSAVMGIDGVCLVRFIVPLGVSRACASELIARGIGRLTGHIPKPRSLLVVGGETLRSLCLCLGTDHLRALGQLLPGVPVSRMVGGRWDGAEVVSKSGAFGDEALLRRITSPKE